MFFLIKKPMTTKPNTTKPSITQYTAKILAILLILANPVTVSAKTTKIAYQPQFSTVTSIAIPRSTMFAFNIATNTENNQAAATDLENAKKLDAYFAKRDMPLAGYGTELVSAANKYNIDWRLLAAIGVRESSGGKHMMNNNPFGWGSAKIKFDDFSEAIDVVSLNLGGYNPNTARYYKNSDTKKKLWYFNGTVMASYPGEVMNIMSSFQ